MSILFKNCLHTCKFFNGLIEVVPFRKSGHIILVNHQSVFTMRAILYTTTTLFANQTFFSFITFLNKSYQVINNKKIIKSIGKTIRLLNKTTKYLRYSFLLSALATIEKMFPLMIFYFSVDLFFLLVSTDSSRGMMITINKVSGQDNASCIKSPPSHPCQTIDYVVSNIKITNNVSIYLESELVSLKTVVTFNNWNNVTVYGTGPNVTTIKCELDDDGDKAGLVFENSQGVQLRKLTIMNCSVSKNFTDTFPYQSGLIIINTTGINMQNIFVVENNGFGVVLINNEGVININSSLFSNNSLDPTLDHIHGGGGMFIIVSACSPISTQCPTHVHLTIGDGNYTILNSNFTHNSRIKPNITGQWTVSYGGGLNIFLRWGSEENVFQILNSLFDSNTAVGGGGMGLAIRDTANNNKITIDNCCFHYNNGSEYGGGGGGIKVSIYAINQINSPYNNTIIINKCNFIANTAIYGAGTSLFASSRLKNSYTNMLIFSFCIWHSNHSPISGAVDIAPDVRQQTDSNFIVEPLFKNCQIIHHNPNPIKSDDSTLFMEKGIFLITKLKVYFEGQTIFVHNHNTALCLISAIVIIKSGSEVTFYNNKGSKGGAIALQEFSIIHYENNVAFNFTHNIASLVGGAIYVSNQEEHLSFASHTCFLQSTNKRGAQNVTFHFQNNLSKNINHSIYMVALHPCQNACEPPIPPNVNPFNDNNDNCLGQFYFNDQQSFEVLTEVSDIKLNASMITVIPGRATYLPVEFRDDLGHDVTLITVCFAEIDHKQRHHSVHLDPLSNVITNNQIILHGQPSNYKQGTVILTPIGTRGSQVKIHFNISHCPPGYVNHKGSCQCSATMDSTHWYNGILGCNDTAMAALVTPGFWMGYIGDRERDESADNLYTSDCPLGYCNVFYQVNENSNGRFSQVKSNPTKNDLEGVICAHNRRGTLCGECVPGTSVYYHSSSYQCNKNNNCHLGFLFYAVSELIPVVVLFTIVLYFDISFTSGSAYSIVFTAQQFRSLEITVQGAIHYQSQSLLTIANALYNILNLNFFTIDKLSFCIWSGATTLDTLIMKYVSIVFAISLVLLLVYLQDYCFSKCRCGRRSSVVQGLTAFLVICYSQCTYVTFNILNQETPRGMGGKHTSKVVFLSGEIPYFRDKHLYYAIPAVVCLCLIVIPIPLILLFDPLLLRIEDRISWCFYRKPWTHIRDRFKPLLDSFQGCFKDCFRCFAGLFFCYHLVILIARFAVSMNTLQYYYGLEIILILILVLQAIVQPFHDITHNIITVLSFCNLVVINLITIRVYSSVSNKGYTTETHILQWIQTIFVYMPLLVATIWLMKKKIRKCFMKVKCLKKSLYQSDNKEHEVSLIYDRDERYGSMEVDGHR